jgi:hypothetical protein
VLIEEATQAREQLAGHGGDAWSGSADRHDAWRIGLA